MAVVPDKKAGSRVNRIEPYQQLDVLPIDEFAVQKIERRVYAAWRERVLHLEICGVGGNRVDVCLFAVDELTDAGAIFAA